jgi:hypothetical protein
MKIIHTGDQAPRPMTFGEYRRLRLQPIPFDVSRLTRPATEGVPPTTQDAVVHQPLPSVTETDARRVMAAG